MTNSEATYLSLDKVNALQPDNLKIDIENRLERSVYKTFQGKPIHVIDSKLYHQNYYWYSCTTTYFKNIGADFICFTIGLNGILIIPIDVVVHYNRFSGWKGEGKKGRQYHVRIKHNQDGTLTFWNFNDPKENIDITQYLYK